MIATGETFGLAEEIIDDTHVLSYLDISSISILHHVESSIGQVDLEQGSVHVGPRAIIIVDFLRIFGEFCVW